ncbi:MAG: cation:proton antiporter, partial [Candidatus Cloacimonadaceae bacterium]|nr:cation:proton antiporter [Candidatus Cloacimonadaceae bacterium]
RMFSKAGAPNILGMLLWGIAIGAIWRDSIPASLWDFSPFFRSLALIVILLRAGLGINRKMLRKAGFTSVLMGFIPCIVEAAGLILAFHLLLGFSFPAAATASFILAAVSPAVVVPSMLNLKTLGFGEKKQIPTMILAGASVDDVFAFTFFTISVNILLAKQTNLLLSVLSIPYSILGGTALGIILGFILVNIFRRATKPIRATEKLLILIAASFLLLELGHLISIAALLGTMTAGFVLYEKENQIANELSSKLSKWWVVAEILLFVLIGMNVQVNQIIRSGLIGLVIIIIGLIFRSAGVFLATIGSGLNTRERLFCVIAYLPKATVQAALGTVPLSLGIAEGPQILSIAVLAIMFTAPLGL